MNDERMIGADSQRPTANRQQITLTPVGCRLMAVGSGHSFVIRHLSAFVAIAMVCLAACLSGCDDANKTTSPAPGSAGNAASSTDAGSAATASQKAKTPEDIARQSEQFAQRLDQQQRASSPYPPNADATPPVTPARVQWLKPQSAPVDAPPPPSAAVATDGAAATPAYAASDLPSRAELIQRLADDLKPRTAAQSAAIRPWLQRASLAVIDPGLELSNDDLKSLSDEDRRLVLAWQRTFSQLGRTLSDDPIPGSPGSPANPRKNRQTLIDLADELASQIAAQQPLGIRLIQLCTRVNGYGAYDAMDKPVFLAGMEHPVIVYAELDHFRTKLDERKRHTVQLSQEMVLYNESDGLPVWRQRPVAINDVSLNQRRDFFTVQVIHLSDRLTVGKYILKLRVTDEVGASVAESSIPLQVVADAKLTNEK
ncbi:MAG: hypothetical protein WC058_09315 [Phycisphaeraceae bacterium]